MGLQKLVKKVFRFSDASDLDVLSVKLKKLQISFKEGKSSCKDQNIRIQTLEMKTAILERRIEFLESRQFLWTDEVDLSVNSDASKAFSLLIVASLRASEGFETLLVLGSDREPNELKKQLSEQLLQVNTDAAQVGVIYCEADFEPGFEKAFGDLLKSGAVCEGGFVRVPNYGTAQSISKEIAKVDASLVCIPMFRESDSKGNWVRLLKGV